MDARRPPPLSLSSMDEKASQPSTERPAVSPPPRSSRLHPGPSFAATPQGYYASPPLALRIGSRLRPWIPLLMYGATSLFFVVAFSWYRDELFAALDQLSLYLQADEQYGHAVLFFLIFLTTIPPVPLYSTLIVLSGYTFGWQTGAIISYSAALFGALLVFLTSRFFFSRQITSWLQSTTTLKRVIHAIEKRPKLLFLIRLAPYPYNVMNCLLAAAPTLTLRTYTLCTALSLFKVVIHTSVGASIKSFRDYHQEPSEDEEGSTLARTWTVVGIGLCIAILIYLSVVARRAVNDELEEDDDEEDLLTDSEERRAFLSPVALADTEAQLTGRTSLSMTESPFRTSPTSLLPISQSR